MDPTEVAYVKRETETGTKFVVQIDGTDIEDGDFAYEENAHRCVQQVTRALNKHLTSADDPDAYDREHDR